MLGLLKPWDNTQRWWTWICLSTGIEIRECHLQTAFSCHDKDVETYMQEEGDEDDACSNNARYERRCPIAEVVVLDAKAGRNGLRKERLSLLPNFDFS